MGKEMVLTKQQDPSKVSVGDVFSEFRNGIIKEYTVTEVDPATGRYYISEPKAKGEYHEGQNRHARRAMKKVMQKIQKSGKLLKKGGLVNIEKPELEKLDESNVDITDESLVGPEINITE